MTSEDGRGEVDHQILQQNSFRMRDLNSKEVLLRLWEGNVRKGFTRKRYGQVAELSCGALDAVCQLLDARLRVRDGPRDDCFTGDNERHRRRQCEDGDGCGLKNRFVTVVSHG